MGGEKIRFSKGIVLLVFLVGGVSVAQIAHADTLTVDQVQARVYPRPSPAGGWLDVVDGSTHASNQDPDGVQDGSATATLTYDSNYASHAVTSTATAASTTPGTTVLGMSGTFSQTATINGGAGSFLFVMGGYRFTTGDAPVTWSASALLDRDDDYSNLGDLNFSLRRITGGTPSGADPNDYLARQSFRSGLGSGLPTAHDLTLGMDGNGWVKGPDTAHLNDVSGTLLANTTYTAYVWGGILSHGLGGSGTLTASLTLHHGSSPVPEPTTLALFGLGAGALALRRRRRKLA